MSNEPKHLMNEADVGSGDKTAADHDTEKLIEQVGQAKKNADAKRGVKPDTDSKKHSAQTQRH
ncbi:MAG: hypothetical protein ACXU7H_12890 [Burkholderiaceae bacterium]